MVDLSSSQTVTSSLPEANNQSNFLQWHAVPCVQGRKNPRIVGTVPLSFWSLEYIWPICPNNLLTIEPIYTCIYILQMNHNRDTLYKNNIYIYKYMHTQICVYTYIYKYISLSLVQTYLKPSARVAPKTPQQRAPPAMWCWPRAAQGLESPGSEAVAICGWETMGFQAKKGIGWPWTAGITMENHWC